MNKEMYKTKPDRILYYVKKEEINSDDIERYPIGYADDGRPVRFVDFSIEPSGEFAVFESGGKFPTHVKRIEVNPSLIKAMFQDIWDEVAPIGIMVLNLSPLTLNSELAKVARLWERGKEKDDVATLAQALRTLLFLRKSWIPTNALPAEVITASVKPESSEPSGKESTENKKSADDKKSTIPWVWIAVAAVVGFAALSGNGKE